jgi:hypothetical protein
MRTVEAVVGCLTRIGAPFALIGGRAVALHGHPRATFDYDFLTSDRRILAPTTWQELAAQGVHVDCRRGASDDPVAGVARLTFGPRQKADVVLARWKWEAAVLDRAEPTRFEGVTVPLPRKADLILLKLAAGGGIDLQDAIALLRTGDRDSLVAEIERHLPDLDADAHAAWERVKVDSARER